MSRIVQANVTPPLAMGTQRVAFSRVCAMYEKLSAGWVNHKLFINYSRDTVKMQFFIRKKEKVVIKRFSNRVLRGEEKRVMHIIHKRA